MNNLMRKLYYSGIRDLEIFKIFGIIGAYRFKKLISKCHSLEDYINFAYSFRFFPPVAYGPTLIKNELEAFSTIRPWQIREEITEFLKLLVKIRPRTVFEIGTAVGGTLFLLTRISSPDAIIVSIDLSGGPFGGGYSKGKIPLYKSFADNQKMFLIRGDSHDPKSFATVGKILGKEKLDLLFIDGDHTYEGVKKDFLMYGKLVKKGGLIAFHDIVPGPVECVGGVPKFWQEIRKRYEYSEIIKNRDQGGCGIGILFIK